MVRSKLITLGMTAAVAGSMAMGLVACGGADNSSKVDETTTESTSSSTSTETTDTEADADAEADADTDADAKDAKDSSKK